MKTLISYVLQDAKEHVHQPEILEITSPPYMFSADPPICEVMKWVEKKQSEIPAGQKLIVLNMYKV